MLAWGPRLRGGSHDRRACQDKPGRGALIFTREREINRCPHKGTLFPVKSVLLTTGAAFGTEHVRGSRPVGSRDIRGGGTR